ncbi:MAG: MmgE/PrpD family protein [Pseudomonadota bacterium]
MDVIDRFADFAAHIAPPEAALAAARLCLLDWYGAAIAGSGEMPAAALRRVLPGDGPSRLIPDGAGRDPRTAALINGTASHIVEVDDIYRPGLYHPGVVTIPAALALAETENASAGHMLRGIIAGYEVGNRIAQAINPAHYRHWHTTGTVGHFGAATAGATVLGLNADQTAHALATAATMAAGLRHAFSSDAMSKPLHAGRAAEAGVLCALAARHGATGVRSILNADSGFIAAMADEVNWAIALEDLGTDWTICNTTPKAHACCGHNFAALDAVRHLVQMHAVEAEDIQVIDVATYRAALEICGNPDPRSAAEGRFSLPWCAAVMAVEGSVTPAAFSDDSLGDKRIRDLAGRVALMIDEEAEAKFPNARSATVILHLKDGRNVKQHRPTRKGDPDDPLSDTDLISKFSALSTPVIGQSAADSLANSILNLSLEDSTHGLRVRDLSD